jgi:hypothetical protein
MLCSIWAQPAPTPGGGSGPAAAGNWTQSIKWQDIVFTGFINLVIAYATAKWRVGAEVKKLSLDSIAPKLPEIKDLGKIVDRHGLDEELERRRREGYFLNSEAERLAGILVQNIHKELFLSFRTVLFQLMKTEHFVTQEDFPGMFREAFSSNAEFAEKLVNFVNNPLVRLASKPPRQRTRVINEISGSLSQLVRQPARRREDG